jgi:uncharacterized protein YdhG (YjbR/CyaY superfamily)
MTVIDNYLEKLNPPQRDELTRIRKIIKTIAPDAEEVIDYGIPAFKLKCKYLIGFQAFKDHMSLFPTPGPINALKNKLVGYKISKGTIQFTLKNPIPASIIKDLVLYKIDQLGNEQKQ